jgi:NADPH:quinone reductase-like Zn-dependent oxidoreductase
VLILGASGGVGTCCVQLAKLAGAEVIVCASSSEKLARLLHLGADHGIDYCKEDFVKWVYAKYGKPHRRRFDGGVDVVVNFTGGDTWVPSLKALHRQGRLLTCGATALYLDLRAQCPRFQWLDARGSDHAAGAYRLGSSSSPSSIASCRSPRQTRRSDCWKIASYSAR